MDQLQHLFELLTESMIEKIQSGEMTAKDWDVIRNFLKDNCVQAKVVKGGPLGNLVDSLPAFDNEEDSDFDISPLRAV